MADIELSSLTTPSMIDKPIFMEPASGDPDFNYSGDDIRILAYMMFPTEGVFSDSEFKITPSSGRTLNISAGRAVIRTMAHAYAGSYVVVANGTTFMTLPANATGQTLTYRILARVHDRYYGDGVYEWEFVALESAPGAQPATVDSLRTALQNVIELGVVTVTNGLATITSSNIFETTREVASGGGGWKLISTFYNGWTSLGNGSLYRNASMRLDNSGTVHMDGLLAANASTTNSGDHLFLIPVGLRPPFVQIINVFSQRAGNRELARIDLFPDGSTMVYSAPSAGPDWRTATNDYISLCGASYSTVK